MFKKNIIGYFVILIICASCGQVVSRKYKRVPIQHALRNRLQERIIQYRERNTEHVCYENVGCFSLPHKKSPLQKVPESPKVIDAKFYLFKRDLNFSTPDVMHFSAGSSAWKSTKFNVSLPLKMIIHGYMSKWNEKGNINVTNSYLKMYDCNVILVDWQRGARGPQYTIAAANTEVVGRIVGFLLLDMINNGLNPKNIHLIGFSLGAHVAGTASEILKMRRHLIARITGLDAASPLFRHDTLREKYKKLDKEDAVFVDVLHTDASPSVTDGFGLWEPIGHVDYFANGGQEQPGCTDTQGSIVVSTFEKNLTREIACSHIRAFHLFMDALMNKLKGGCQFIAYSCHGGLSEFESGRCFPEMAKNGTLDLDPSFRSEIGQFGENARGEGVMYFSTSDLTPFCGTQLQATVDISEKSTNVQGNLVIVLKYGNHTVKFKIAVGMSRFINLSKVGGYGVAEYNTLTSNVTEINVEIFFFEFKDEKENNIFSSILYIDGVQVRDMYGNRWRFCSKDVAIPDKSKAKTVLSKNVNCK